MRLPLTRFPGLLSGTVLFKLVVLASPLVVAGCFGAFGFRIVETRFANARIFFQIWDSRDGTIAWERMQETLFAKDRITEEPITFRMAIEQTARDLIARLP